MMKEGGFLIVGNLLTNTSPHDWLHYFLGGSFVLDSSGSSQVLHLMFLLCLHSWRILQQWLSFLEIVHFGTLVEFSDYQVVSFS